MHARRSVHLALVVAACVWAAPASAYHADDEHVLSYTAHTLDQGELAVGLWDLTWGPWDWLTVSTYTWPWFVKAGNILGVGSGFETTSPPGPLSVDGEGGWPTHLWATLCLSSPAPGSCTDRPSL